jgi:hypothetical protein
MTMLFSRTPALLRPATVSLMETRDEEILGAPRQLILMPTTSSGETSDDQARSRVRSPVSSVRPAANARWTASGWYDKSTSMSPAAADTTRLLAAGLGRPAQPEAAPARNPPPASTAESLINSLRVVIRVASCVRSLRLF